MLFVKEVHVYRVAYHVAIILGDEQEIIVPFQVIFSSKLPLVYATGCYSKI